MNIKEPFDFTPVYVILFVSFICLGLSFIVLSAKPVLGLILALLALGGFFVVLNKCRS